MVVTKDLMVEKLKSGEWIREAVMSLYKGFEANKGPEGITPTVLFKLTYHGNRLVGGFALADEHIDEMKTYITETPEILDWLYVYLKEKFGANATPAEAVKA